MQQTLPVKPPEVKNKLSRETESDEHFQPKGAIAFFILLVLLGLFIWFSVYFLMLERI